MDPSIDHASSSSKPRITQAKSKASITSRSIDSRATKKQEPPLTATETSPEVYQQHSVSSHVTQKTKHKNKKKKQPEPRFYPSPTNTFYTAPLYTEAKQSFSDCASTLNVGGIDLEKMGVLTYRGSTGSDESSSSGLSNSAGYKPHRANNDKRWVAIQEVRSRVGSSLEAKDFKLVKRLGGGDIGTVYLAELIGTGETFAVKVMEKAAIAARKKLVRAQTEREILQSLDHPFLPTLYSHFETENHSCLVMEFCPGGDLHSLRQKQPGKYFPEHAARFYVAEVLLAMEYLHMLGIIYRDLKPENVLVREDGHIMLSDFDLSLRCSVSPTLVRFAATTTLESKPSSYCIQPSCIVQPDCIQPVCFTPRFLSKSKNKKKLNESARQVRPLPELMAEPTSARSMSFVGTHEYLAPEIIKGEGHGSAVDWWTFGIFLYELLFGKTPFRGDVNRATLFNVVGQPLRFPEHPSVSFAARDLIRGLLVKEPQHRLAYRRGATEIKQHPFFQSINWALIRCTVEKSGSYHRDKDPVHAGFYPEGNGRNGSRRSVPDDDDDGERLKSRQHPGEAWPSRGRLSHEEGDDAMMSYYDTRKSSEQDESRQPYWDRPRTRRSGSRSNSRSMSRSRSRSRSPLQRVRRDGRESYDRHKTRDNDGRYSRAGDYDWEAKNRDTKYYNEDSREQYPLRRSDYPEDHSNSRRETSDPILRSHRDRRDVPEREYNRVSNVPCRYFPLGNCRNGTSCRFSHHGARRSLERKPQDQMFSRHDSCGTTERMRNSHRWNERSDTGKSNEGSKGDNNNNNGSWIGDMEMSPDWNYGVKTLKNPLKEEHGVVKDTLAPAYEHGSAAISHSHHGFSNNNIANTAPPVQVFNQNIENHSAVPYQSTPLAVGGSQVLPPPPPAVTTTHLPENGIAQNTVSREQLNHISNISASLAQFFGNGQPIPQLQSTLNPKQAMQVPEVYGKEEQSSHAQSDLLNSIQTGVVPALQILNSDTLISLAGNPKASFDEDRDKKIDEEASKEPDVRKTEQEGGEETGKDAEEEEEEDENSKKEKDPKGMKAFKFALVEIVKELLKPAWKEGGMNKDAYKNIVKKAVDKVTGAIQTGNIPQTQEKIDHYLSASKPKLTKLVQAYISKVKKS